MFAKKFGVCFSRAMERMTLDALLNQISARRILFDSSDMLCRAMLRPAATCRDAC